MSNLLIVILFSLAGSMLSLLGGFLLVTKRVNAKSVVKYATPFAAGALLAAAFMDALPEAGHQGNIEIALQWTLIGILSFFFLERSIKWFHHHHAHKNSTRDATVPLIIAGDTVHNFLDGAAIAAAFLIDVPTGIIATLAVAAHEIPQEIGDFGLLLDKGVSKANVIKANLLSALATTLAALIFYTVGDELSFPLDIALGLVAGFFIYIAVSDVIPGIRKNAGNKIINTQTVMLIVGAVLISSMSTALHSYIDAEEAARRNNEIHSERIHDHHESHGHSH